MTSGDDNGKDWLNHLVAVAFIVIVINSLVTTCASTRALDKVESLKKDLPKDGSTVVNNVKVEQNCMFWGTCDGADQNSEIGSPKNDKDNNWPWR